MKFAWICICIWEFFCGKFFIHKFHAILSARRRKIPFEKKIKKSNLREFGAKLIFLASDFLATKFFFFGFNIAE